MTTARWMAVTAIRNAVLVPTSPDGYATASRPIRAGEIFFDPTCKFAPLPASPRATIRATTTLELPGRIGVISYTHDALSGKLRHLHVSSAAMPNIKFFHDPSQPSILGWRVDRNIEAGEALTVQRALPVTLLHSDLSGAGPTFSNRRKSNRRDNSTLMEQWEFCTLRLADLDEEFIRAVPFKFAAHVSDEYAQASVVPPGEFISRTLLKFGELDTIKKPTEISIIQRAEPFDPEDVSWQAVDYEGLKSLHRDATYATAYFNHAAGMGYLHYFEQLGLRFLPLTLRLSKFNSTSFQMFFTFDAKSSSETHQDSTSSILFVKSGKKRVYIAPPRAQERHERLVKHRNYLDFSPHDSALRSSLPHWWKCVVVESNEAVFIPANWWHEVISEPHTLAFSCPIRVSNSKRISEAMKVGYDSGISSAAAASIGSSSSSSLGSASTASSSSRIVSPDGHPEADGILKTSPLCKTPENNSNKIPGECALNDKSLKRKREDKNESEDSLRDLFVISFDTTLADKADLNQVNDKELRMFRCGAGSTGNVEYSVYFKMVSSSEAWSSDIGACRRLPCIFVTICVREHLEVELYRQGIKYEVKVVSESISSVGECRHCFLTKVRDRRVVECVHRAVEQLRARRASESLQACAKDRREPSTLRRSRRKAPVRYSCFAPDCYSNLLYLCPGRSETRKGKNKMPLLACSQHMPRDLGWSCVSNEDLKKGVLGEEADYRQFKALADGETGL